MSNTYSQLIIHVVFAVKGRCALIPEIHRNRIEKYITGVIQGEKSKVLEIYCMPDHCHILIGINPEQSLSSLMQKAKSKSSGWINKENLLGRKFYWQRGYGAFSYSKSQIPTVAKYIANQPIHHKKRTFKEEYIQLLEKFEVEYRAEYIMNEA